MCVCVCINQRIIHYSRIKHAMCFGLLSHYQALIKNTKKPLNTAAGARSPTLRVIILYKCI